MMGYDTTILNDKIKRRHSKFGRVFGHFMLKLIGWKIIGQFPQEKKFVIIVAPHTSNWDFIIGLFAYFALDFELRWMGKHTIFKWPLGVWFRKWGGIPVERSSKHDIVAQIVDEFNRNESFVLALSPEGTRTKIPKWKTGFYYIAVGAKVPIQCVAFDFKQKNIEVGKLIYTSSDFESDMKEIQSFYKLEMAKYEEKYNTSIY